MSGEEADWPPVEALSVQQLIARHEDASDPWRLALVQRSEVWDELRIAKLLDSLLAGYPIGTLLICRLRQKAHVIEQTAKGRIVERAAPGSCQLLDGQQRVNAIVSLFSERGQRRFGRFLLDMSVEREAEDLGARKRDRQASTRYIRWQDGTASTAESFDGRGHCVDLSRWHAWASARDEAALNNVVVRDALGALKSLDPEFDPDLTPPERQVAEKRLRRLVELWYRREIPVQNLQLNGPMDVLQVFTRINLEGVDVASEDIFFAAVRTLWPDVEEHLERLQGDGSAPVRGQPASPLIDRMPALRILARLASYCVQDKDVLPLEVSRLSGDRGTRIVDCMCSIATEGSPVVARVRGLAHAMIKHSRLGYALRDVPSQLLDHVFGWAAVNRRAEEPEFLRQAMETVDAYLAGASSFGYAVVFGTPYLRRAFLEAIAAGVEGAGFPLERILDWTRATYPEGKRGRVSIWPVVTEDEQIAIVNGNAEMFLSVVQCLTYALPARLPERFSDDSRVVEWDHIWPQKQADRMRVRDPSTGRLNNHEDHDCVWWTGNLWALDQPLNNFARDWIPSQKLAWFSTLPDGEHPALWPADRFFTDVERVLLLQAEDALCADPQRLRSGMKAFRDFARGRTLRIWRAMLDAVPRLASFAAQGGPGGEVDEPLLGDIAGAMGIVVRPPDPTPNPEPDGNAADDGRFASVLNLARDYGVERELSDLIRTARELGLYIHPYPSCVMIAPPQHGGRMLVTVWPEAAEGGSFWIERSPSKFHEFFPEISEERAREAIGEGVGVLSRAEFGAPWLNCVSYSWGCWCNAERTEVTRRVDERSGITRTCQTATVGVSSCRDSVIRGYAHRARFQRARDEGGTKAPESTLAHHSPQAAGA